MKKLLLTIALLTSLTATARPLDDGHTVKSKESAEILADYVESLGYKCSSLSSLLRSSWSGNVTLICNNWRYEYEFEDVGGQWRMTVKN